MVSGAEVPTMLLMPPGLVTVTVLALVELTARVPESCGVDESPTMIWYVPVGAVQPLDQVFQ